MKLIKLVLLALVVSSTGVQLFSQQTLAAGTLAGKVTDAKGTPLPGMKVFLQNSEVKRETTNDQEGNYRLETPAGTYVVRTGTDCTQTFQQKDVQVVEARTVSNKDVKLESISSDRAPKEVNYFDAKYVLIEGTFNKNSCGHMGMSSGEITNVSRIVELKRYFDGKKEVNER